ncbi:hypothetical protein T265_03612 [Opisthorchis viverrini]|uniref:Uncharacterized protein n=1 Tax=Opisthorchis viverrini TaxID=6198 RepID=A0A074ZQX5_OPIVI|nr:hypothetical protein T265_03612 [Opisthorchis viverrini]KER29813.1 hypothetical protein T265_03612 [Opisthorchis viverrini]
MTTTSEVRFLLGIPKEQLPEKQQRTGTSKIKKAKKIVGNSPGLPEGSNPHKFLPKSKRDWPQDQEAVPWKCLSELGIVIRRDPVFDG